MGIDRFANHENRLSTLEADMIDVKVAVASIAVKLDASEVRAADRFAALSASSMEVKEILNLRDQEAREYRDRREKIEHEASIEYKRWIRSLVNPQTIFIVLAIVMSMLGLRMNDIQVMASAIGTPLLKPPVEVIVEEP